MTVKAGPIARSIMNLGDIHHDDGAHCSVEECATGDMSDLDANSPAWVYARAVTRHGRKRQVAFRQWIMDAKR